jgi:hypothetical protein
MRKVLLTSIPVAGYGTAGDTVTVSDEIAKELVERCLGEDQGEATAEPKVAVEDAKAPMAAPVVSPAAKVREQTKK